MALYSKEGVKNIDLVDPTPGLIDHPPDPSCINPSCINASTTITWFI